MWYIDSPLKLGKKLTRTLPVHVPPLFWGSQSQWSCPIPTRAMCVSVLPVNVGQQGGWDTKWGRFLSQVDQSFIVVVFRDSLYRGLIFLYRHSAPVCYLCFVWLFALYPMLGISSLHDDRRSSKFPTQSTKHIERQSSTTPQNTGMGQHGIWLCTTTTTTIRHPRCSDGREIEEVQVGLDLHVLLTSNRLDMKLKTV